MIAGIKRGGVNFLRDYEATSPQHKSQKKPQRFPAAAFCLRRAAPQTKRRRGVIRGGVMKLSDIVL
jgi:hypothetical protein